jgi:hypothetical protein
MGLYTAAAAILSIAARLLEDIPDFPLRPLFPLRALPTDLEPEVLLLALLPLTDFAADERALAREERLLTLEPPLLTELLPPSCDTLGEGGLGITGLITNSSVDISADQWTPPSRLFVVLNLDT